MLPICCGLLDGPHPLVAGRLAGGFRAIGRAALAEEIVGTMRSVGHGVTEVSPFGKPFPGLLAGGRPESP
ncbi:MAG: hypothetical protein IT529_21765 [Burkholderiales bacterium]|nr:hypothetical protein [Burkholderiales bacterium]